MLTQILPWISAEWRIKFWQRGEGSQWVQRCPCGKSSPRLLWWSRRSGEAALSGVEMDLPGSERKIRPSPPPPPPLSPPPPPRQSPPALLCPRHQILMEMKKPRGLKMSPSQNIKHENQISAWLALSGCTICDPVCLFPNYFPGNKILLCPVFSNITSPAFYFIISLHQLQRERESTEYKHRLESQQIFSFSVG